MVVLVAAFVLAAVATPLFRAAAQRWGVLDRPNVRSSHQTVVPRGGGVAIALSVMAALWLARPAWEGRPGALTLLSGGVALAAVGLWDDRFGLSPLSRFAAQLAVAVVVVFGLGGLVRLPLPPPVDPSLGPLAGPLAVLWIVAVVNFYNFLDGIDGLAALQATLTGVGILLAAWDPLAALAGAALAGAAAGFLLFNWSPASVFLGDVGSYFLGYTLAALPLLAPEDDRPRAAAFVALSLWLFLADATWTLARRVRRGERWYQAHREHLYQHLALRFGHARVAAAIGLGSAALTAAALAAWTNVGPAWTWAALGLGAVLTVAEWMMVRSGRTG
jgi:Fuc2NAc and GlcNAc transferase